MHSSPTAYQPFNGKARIEIPEAEVIDVFDFGRVAKVRLPGAGGTVDIPMLYVNPIVD